MNVPATVASRLMVWASMIKVSHSVFVLPFALIATFLAGRGMANYLPYPSQIVLIVLCMVLARCVAMTYNRLVDLEFDAANPRTADRDLPAGRISWRMALFFLGICVGGFIAATMGFWWFHDNPWPGIFSVPVLIVLCGYSYCKRFTQWSHLILGAVEGLSPIAAWIAIDPGSLGLEAFILGAAITVWIGGFDIIYACQDVEFDRKVGLFSLPASWGIAKALRVTRVCHVLTVGLLVWLGVVAPMGLIYFAGVGVVGVLLLVENLMVKADDLSKVNLAFFTMNGVVAVVLGIGAIVDILLGVL